MPGVGKIVTVSRFGNDQWTVAGAAENPDGTNTGNWVCLRKVGNPDREEIAAEDECQPMGHLPT